MPSLSDHIDLIARNTKNISVAARRTPTLSSAPGPFTSAILHAHLGDLIRDVDPSELGLFSLVQPDRAAIQEKPVEIERVNFHGATPLRRSHPRNDDASRAREADPELYAQAAMKYMDRYKVVRPMPRAQAQVQVILERIPTVRQSLAELNDTLYQLGQTRSSTEPDYKLRLEEEERRIRDLRAKLAKLTNKRAALTKAKKSHLDLAENKGLTRKPIASSKPKSEEEEFWNTPAAPARAFKFSGDNLLVDEKADFGDMSAISFSATPIISKATTNIFTNTVLGLTPENPDRQLIQSSDTLPDTDVTSEPSHLNPQELTPSPTQDLVQHENPKPNAEIDLSTAAAEEATVDNSSDIIVTNRVELITNKVWTVMSDLVVTAATTKNTDLREKPSAREIIRYLELLQEVIPADELSSTTNNSAPTLQQVLTAALLVGLLSSSAEHSLPLVQVKELLTTRTENTVNPSQPNTSRIVYGCVAKRLLKIDRSGGEQVVRFDV